MIKLNKKHLIFISLMFFIFSHNAFAGVSINEIQISPTEGRFIELYNSSNSSVDLTDWYIQRKTAGGSTFGSLVSKTNFEGKSIGANDYFLISRSGLSNSDIIFDGLILTESNSILLKNNNGDIIDKVGWGESIDCSSTCPVNPGEGKSIQKTSDGSWIVANPTPRAGNQIIQNINEDDTVNNSIVNSDSNSSKDVSKIYDIATKIISPKIVTAGVPFTIDHLTTGIKKEKIILGKFVWNFGDGMVKELNISNPFSYTYQYSGEYILSLSFSDSALDTNPDATDKLLIKVVPAGITISSIGTVSDSFIEIENNSPYEMSLNDFIIKGSIHSFYIPKGTVIISNKKIKFSPKITGFEFNDLNYIEIIDSTGQVFSVFPKQKISFTKSYSNKNETFIKSEIVNNNEDEDEIINLNNLPASVGNISNGLDNKILIYLGLLGVILIGVISIILIRRKVEYPDYVEKEISAKDMTIIE